MLTEAVLAEFVEKLRTSQVRSDVIELLGISCREDRDEDPKEIAKTILEMLEPERLGGIVWVNRGLCPNHLNTDGEHDWVPKDAGEVCVGCGATK